MNPIDRGRPAMRPRGGAKVVAILALATAGCSESETYRVRADAIQMAMAQPPDARDDIAVAAERSMPTLPVFIRASLLESAARARSPSGKVLVTLNEVDHRTGAGVFLLVLGSAAVVSGLGVT